MGITPPHIRSALVDKSGRTDAVFYRWFQQVCDALMALQAAGGESLDTIQSIATALGSPDGDVANIPAQTEPLELRVQGVGSIQSIGLLSNGLVQLTLLGDSDEPGLTRYYGTDATGEKSWYAISDALASTPDIERVVGADGITTLGLADLANAGGGTLQKTARDGKGRLAGTSTATTSDLSEGANLYFTDARAQAAVSGAYFAISQRFAELPDETAIIAARTNLGLQNIDGGTFT